MGSRRCPWGTSYVSRPRTLCWAGGRSGLGALDYHGHPRPRLCIVLVDRDKCTESRSYSHLLFDHDSLAASELRIHVWASRTLIHLALFSYTAPSANNDSPVVWRGLMVMKAVQQASPRSIQLIWLIYRTDRRLLPSSPRSYYSMSTGRHRLGISRFWSSTCLRELVTCN
jgi:hypothetical protein